MRYSAAILILLASSGALFAQDAGERVNVPLTDPSRPARIHVNLLMGSIVVHGADVRDVLVETRPKGHDEVHEPPPPPNAAGMHRLGGGSPGLDIVEQDNLVTIKVSGLAAVRHEDLVLTVPRHSSLQLKTITDGDIYVEQTDGEIDADALNGKITLKNVSGAVVAHSLNGAISATLDQVDSTKPMSFSTLNGDIDVTLPDNARATLHMKTDNGEIYSDFDVKLESGSHTISNSGPGSHRIRVDHTLRGTINGGGPDYQFTTFNGQIFIRKRK